MRVKRGYGGSAAVGKYIYVMGGGNNSEWLQDAQRLDVTTGEWTRVGEENGRGGKRGGGGGRGGVNGWI